MPTTKPLQESPSAALDRMKNKIRAGNRLLLDSLEPAELAAIQSLIFSEEAEIINEACKPYVIAKLDKFII